MKKIFNVVLLFLFIIVSHFIIMCSSGMNETLTDIVFDYPVPDGLITDSAEKEAMIDAKLTYLLKRNKYYWGDLPEDTEILSYLFYSIWSRISNNFPGFYGLEVDWDEFGENGENILESIDNYGEYVSLMTEMSYLIKEGHSLVIPGRMDKKFMKDDAPVFYPFTYNISRIGACYTVTEDEELIVTKPIGISNPYNLSAGDEIVGFNGVPWQEWAERIVESGLPIYGSAAASDESIKYNLLKAGMTNPHLFEKINIKRYDTGEIETLPVENIRFDWDKYDPCTEYIGEVPGVKTPKLGNNQHQTLSYGIIDDTNIGYIYLTDLPQGFDDFASYDNWNPYETVFSNRFEKAILELMNTDGLIIDLRYNRGGRDGIVFKGFSHLINKEEEVEIFIGKIRDSSSEDREALVHQDYNVNYPLYPDEPNQYYKNPIIVMTGPDCISAGDALVHFLSKFDEFTIIGRETNGSNIHVTAMSTYEEGDETVNHYMGFFANFFADEPDTILLRKTGFIDIPIWHNKEDIAKGIDTVRKYAMKLILNSK